MAKDKKNSRKQDIDDLPARKLGSKEQEATKGGFHGQMNLSNTKSQPLTSATPTTPTGRPKGPAEQV